MLSYYAEKLHGVELNGSFYRTPPETTMLKWRDGTPGDFRFCMKAHRGLTYSGDQFDRIGLARIITERMAPLGDRMGPMLLQFPPIRKRDVALLDGLLSALGRGVAAEFRDESWFHEETFSVLRTYQAALVVTDEEKWPRAPFVEVGPVAYFRLRRGYTSRALEPWLETLRTALDTHDEVHVYFKHDPGAPRLALRVQRALGR